MERQLIAGAGCLILLAAISDGGNIVSPTIEDIVPLPSARPSPAQEAADPHPSIRQKNYKGGSCVHASTATALRWHQRYDLADWWVRNNSGGEWVACFNCNGTLLQDLDRAGIPYIATDKGDQRVLEFASATRRMAIIEYYPNHSINFAGFTPDGKARLLDNNRTKDYIYVDKATFIRNWRGYGGDAVVLMLPPPPPEILP